MLTGLYPPTSGAIIINGKNMQTDLSTIRMELGVCPQQDILFDNLTVLEHLLLFASIKAPQWTQSELRQHVDKSVLVSPAPSAPCKLGKGMKGTLWKSLWCLYEKREFSKQF